MSAALPPLPPPPARLLVDCNQLAVDIDNEIVVVYNFIRDKVGGALALAQCCLVCRGCRWPLHRAHTPSPQRHTIHSTHPPSHPLTRPLAPLQYKTKFPELESLVHNPLEYARVVQVGALWAGGG